MEGFDLIIQMGDERLAADASDGRYIPDGTTISSTWQGGHRTLDCSLLRTAGDPASSGMYADVKVMDVLGASVWEGEVRRPDPRTIEGNAGAITPQASGYCAAVEDREDVQFLGIDRDLSAWKPMDLDRRGSVLTGFTPRDASAQGGALLFDGSGIWSTSAGRPFIAASYDAGALEVGRVMWPGGVGRNVDGGWKIQVLADGVFVGDNATVAGTGSIPSMLSAEPGRDMFMPPGTSEVELSVYHVAGSIAADAQRTVELKGPVVLGPHDLPLVGTSAADYGLRASDCWRWLVQQFADDMRPGYIADSVLGIPHIAEYGGAKLGEILNGINAFHGWSWGVWKDRKVDFHPYGEGPSSRTWRVRSEDPGVDFKEEGENGDVIYTDVVVAYSTPSGDKRSVGAPGTLAHEHHALLQITDPLHPAVAAGKRRVKRFDLGVVALYDQAVAAGYTYLQQLQLSRRAGMATITGYVEDFHSGVRVPSYWVRGGDLLVVTDVGDETPRRIVEATATPGDARVVCTLDDSLQFADMLLAHWGAQLTGRI